MNGFIRVLIYGLALVGAFLATAIMVGVMLFGQQVKTLARQVALTEDERAVLAAHAGRPDELPALVPLRRTPSEAEMLERLAEQVNEGAIRSFVETFSQRTAELDDRSAWIERQEGELALARASLQRDQQLLEQRRAEVQQMLIDLESRQSNWAALQAAEAQRLTAIEEAELERLAELAVMYAASKREWWRDAQPEEVARIMLLMDARNASKALDRMAQDPESPGLPMIIHREMMTVDLDSATADHIQRQADLYQLMKADQVMPYFAESSVEEIARILVAINDPVRRERLLVALREADQQKGREVEVKLLAGVEEE